VKLSRTSLGFFSLIGLAISAVGEAVGALVAFTTFAAFTALTARTTLATLLDGLIFFAMIFFAVAFLAGRPTEFFRAVTMMKPFNNSHTALLHAQ